MTDPVSNTTTDDGLSHLELMSARDQIARNRRCEKYRGDCMASSTLYRDCQCLRSAIIRAERKHRRRGPPEGMTHE